MAKLLPVAAVAAVADPRSPRPSRLQSWELVHFLSSTVSRSCFLLLRPHPEVRYPSREKALITDGLFGTLFGLGDSISGT